MKKAIFRTSVLAILVAGGWYGYRYYKQMPERQDLIPTAKVQRGDVVIRALFPRRTARGAHRNADRAEPVRHRAGDRPGADGFAGVKRRT